MGSVNWCMERLSHLHNIQGGIWGGGGGGGGGSEEEDSGRKRKGGKGVGRGGGWKGMEGGGGGSGRKGKKGEVNQGHILEFRKGERIQMHVL